MEFLHFVLKAVHSNKILVLRKMSILVIRKMSILEKGEREKVLKLKMVFAFKLSKTYTISIQEFENFQSRKNSLF